MRHAGHTLQYRNALLFGLLGGGVGVAVDGDYLLHQGLGLPYRFWHTPELILGCCLTVVSLIYLRWHFPTGKHVYRWLLALVVALALVTHVAEDYIFNWF